MKEPRLPAFFGLALWTYGRLLPEAVRREILADLHGEYREARAGGAGWVRVGCWLARDVLTTEYVALHRLARRTHRQRRYRLAEEGARTMVGHEIWSEIVHAYRGLRRARALSALVIATMGLGVGAFATVGAVLGSVLLRPLPFEDADRLVTVAQVDPADSGVRVNASAPLYERWSMGYGVLSEVAAYRGPGWTMVTDGPQPERVPSVRVTTGLLGLLGVEPQWGRPFNRSDDSPDAERTVIVSAALAARMGLGPADIGGAVSLDGEPHVVVGVMPRGFELIERGVEVWYPYEPTRSAGWDQWTLKVVGRLASDIGVAEAQRSLADLQESLRSDDAGRDILPSVVVRSVRDELVGTARAPLLATAGGVLLALLIAGVNVGGLLLSRNVTRRSELVMMRVLGAHRRRVVAHVVAQGALLSAGGLIVGTFVAVAGVHAARQYFPADFPRLQSISFDGYALTAAGLSALLIALLAGLLSVPWSDDRLQSGLRRRRGSFKTLGTIMVGQIAMTFVLLTTGASLGRSFLAMASEEPGIDPDGVLTVDLRLPPSEAASDATARTFVARVDDAVSGLPGVTAVGQIQRLPFAGGNWTSYLSDPEDPPQDDVPEADVRVVTPGYLSTVRLSLLRGRSIEPTDGADGPKVVLVNEALARTMWPGAEPIGRRLVVDMFDREPAEVVGVVGSVRHHGLATPPRPEVYVPYAQRPVAFSTLVVRAEGLSVESVRNAVARVQPGASVSRPGQLSDLVSGSIAAPRMHALVFAAMSLLALVLAGIGVFTASTFRVVQEDHELGLRAALGASSSRLRRRVLSGSGRSLAFGLALGALGSLPAVAAIEALLYEVSPTDPWTYAIVLVALGCSCGLATVVPSLRAGRVEPMSALRRSS